MNYVTITQEASSWRQLLGILSEITHGSRDDQKLIEEFTAEVNHEIKKQTPHSSLTTCKGMK